MSPLYSISLLFPVVLIGTFGFIQMPFSRWKLTTKSWSMASKPSTIGRSNFEHLSSFPFCSQKHVQICGEIVPEKTKNTKTKFRRQIETLGLFKRPSWELIAISHLSQTTGWSIKKWIEIVLFIGFSVRDESLVKPLCMFSVCKESSCW